MVLLLYAACFLVTMFSARERRYRRASVPEVRGDTRVSLLLSQVETGSDPGYESGEDSEHRALGAEHRLLPRLTSNRIILMLRRCGPGKLVFSLPKLALNVRKSISNFLS